MLRSLKRQRKQQRLAPFESFIDSEEQLIEWEREIDQPASDLGDFQERIYHLLKGKTNAA